MLPSRALDESFIHFYFTFHLDIVLSAAFYHLMFWSCYCVQDDSSSGLVNRANNNLKFSSVLFSFSFPFPHAPFFTQIRPTLFAFPKKTTDETISRKGWNISFMNIMNMNTVPHLQLGFTLNFSSQICWFYMRLRLMRAACSMVQVLVCQHDTFLG